MAPEFLRDGTITLKIDIYSLGVIIMEILMGCREYPNVDEVIIIYHCFKIMAAFF